MNFDKILDRRENGSVKWNLYQDKNIIPLWIADMDFQTPAPIREAIKNVVDYGVLGYTQPKQKLYDVIQKMLAEKYDWQIEQDWIVLLPSLIPGLYTACNSFCQPNDEVMLSTPIYNNFFPIIKTCNCQSLSVPLLQENDGWSMDYNRIRKSITPKTKMTIFCNPHNPVGRVYSREEIKKVGDICIEKDLIICSDEIHCGLILDPDKKHIPTATISPEIAERTITLMSPGKTFNLGGVNCGFAIISNPTLRRKYRLQMLGATPFVNIFALEAMNAAYTQCDLWHGVMIDYLRGNRKMVAEAVAQMKGVSTTHVEGTFLSWLDARELGVPDPAKFFEEAGVGLSNGADFGSEGFLRLNFATQRSNLEVALERMIQAVNR